MLTNRLLEYELPSDEELVSRILASVHRGLDEQFPGSAKLFEGPKRFARTDFSSVSEDTIIEHSPGPASGETIQSADVARTEVPPPPKTKPNPQMGVSEKISAPETVSKKSAASPFNETPRRSRDLEQSLELPANLTSLSKPLSRTQVSTSTSTSTNFTSAVSRRSKRGVSLKLFSFLFAILLGLAIGSVIFLFWYR